MARLREMMKCFAACSMLSGIAVPTQIVAAQTPSSTSWAVGPQYDSTHVYTAPDDASAFVKQFLGTFGGESTKAVVTTVTPTPSSTSSQILRTPEGTISLFAYRTSIPAPFGEERTGWLVKDLDAAVAYARSAGAEVVVSPFKDPIGRDAVIRFPGGLMTQLYWHTTPPTYAPLLTVPENRVYVSQDRAEDLLRSVLQFTGGTTVSDVPAADGIEIGREGYKFRRIEIESAFGKTLVLVTDGILPFPYGREITGYEVKDLSKTLAKATSLGADIVVAEVQTGERKSAMVQFAGGYVAEIHQRLVGIQRRNVVPAAPARSRVEPKSTGLRHTE